MFLLNYFYTKNAYKEDGIVRKDRFQTGNQDKFWFQIGMPIFHKFYRFLDSKQF